MMMESHEPLRRRLQAQNHFELDLDDIGLNFFRNDHDNQRQRAWQDRIRQLNQNIEIDEFSSISIESNISNTSHENQIPVQKVYRSINPGEIKKLLE